ncbi:MAG: NAD-dependent epimerase/dehydratase family protein, partial [Achromobacter pestifer]
MPKVLVTGGSGKLGRAVLRDLVAHGHDVLNIDQHAPPEPVCP